MTRALMQVTGWFAAIAVDNVTYRIIGVPSPGVPSTFGATQLAVDFTPTRTNFTFQAGPVNVGVSFFSPVQVRKIRRTCVVNDE